MAFLLFECKVPKNIILYLILFSNNWLYLNESSKNENYLLYEKKTKKLTQSTKSKMF